MQALILRILVLASAGLAAAVPAFAATEVPVHRADATQQQALPGVWAQLTTQMQSTTPIRQVQPSREGTIPLETLGIEKPRRFRLLSLDFIPTVATAGSTLTVRFTIENQGEETLPEIEYMVSGNLSVKKGTVGPIASGQQRSVSVDIEVGEPPLAGVYVELDRENKLRERESLRADNYMGGSVTVVTGTPDQWAAWAGKAADRVPAMLQAGKRQTYVKGGDIRGPKLTITGLSFRGPGADSQMSNLERQGVPTRLIQALLGSVHLQLRDWGDNYRSTQPLAYPAFAAWPGPTADNVPSVPVPVGVAGGSLTVNSEVRSAKIEQRVRATLGGLADEPGASEAIRSFSTSAAAHIAHFLATTKLLVLGGGRAPTYAPPRVPVAPVVDGWPDLSQPCLM